jgi:hypothetical protein
MVAMCLNPSVALDGKSMFENGEGWPWSFTPPAVR